MSLPSKEALVSERQKFPVVERQKAIEFSPELKKVESVTSEETLVLQEPIVGEDGAIILDNPTSQQVVVKLPLSDDQINQALHLKVIYSLRWLAEWAKRLLKITGGKFAYKF